jgi:hypothetical protein
MPQTDICFGLQTPCTIDSRYPDRCLSPKMAAKLSLKRPNENT